MRPICNIASEKMRGFGGFQTLLTGDTETG